MSLYREMGKPGFFPEKSQTNIYSDTSHPGGLRKKLLTTALGIGAFMLLSKGGSRFSKTIISTIKSGIFKESSFISRGYREAKQMGILRGNFSDVFKIVSSTFRKADYGITKISKPWTRAYDAFTKNIKRARKVGRASRNVRNLDFFKKYPIKDIARGAFVKGAREAIGFTFLSAASEAFVHSAKPEERDINKKYGVRAIPRVAKEFASSLGSNVLFFGVGRTISTAAKIGFYGPGMRNFVKRHGIDKIIGNIYGYRQRVMEWLVSGSSFAHRFTQELHANIRFPYRERRKKGVFKSIIQTAMKHAVEQKKTFRKAIKQSEFFTNLKKLADVGVVGDKIPLDILHQVADKNRISNIAFALGMSREKMSPSEALEMFKNFRKLGAKPESLGKMFKSFGWDPKVAEEIWNLSEEQFSRLQSAGKVGALYKPGFIRIGNFVRNSATAGIFKNQLLANVPEHYKGIANILMSVTGTNFYGSRILARFFAPSKSGNQTDYIIGKKRISLQSGGKKHGIFYFDRKFYKIGNVYGHQHDVSLVAQGIEAYETNFLSAAKGEAYATWLSAQGLQKKLQQNPSNPVRNVKSILKKWIKFGSKAVSYDDVGFLSDYYNLNKITIFGKMIEDSRMRRVIKNAFGKDNPISKILDMDTQTLIKAVEKTVTSEGVAPKAVQSHIVQVLNYAQSHTNEQISAALANNHVGKEFSRITMDTFLRSFLIDHSFPTPEIRVKTFDIIDKSLRKSMKVPKIYRDWISVMKRLPSDNSIGSPDKNVLKLFLRASRDIPRVDVFRPVSSILKLGNLGIDSPFDLNKFFNPESGRRMGPLRFQPFVALSRSLSLTNKKAPTPFEVWASTPIRSIWGFIGSAKRMLSIKPETISYASERIPALNDILSMKPFSSLRNGVSLIPFDTNIYNKRVMQLTKDLWKPLALYGGLSMGYKLMDTILDDFPIPGLHNIVENSAFGNGITPFIYNAYALGRLALAKMGDIIGITSAAQYFEGLMPGSTDWLPGAVAGAVMNAPLGLSGAVLGSLVYGGVNKMLSPFLPDMTKSTQDLEDLYSGRKDVAVRRSRYWPLGLTPWEGEGIDYYRPSTYHMVQSQFRKNQGGYGSRWQDLLMGDWFFGFNPIRNIFDPMYKERQHYFSRPAPLTQLPFWDVPLIGPALAVTVGQVLKPQQMMHITMLKETLPGVVSLDAKQEDKKTLMEEMTGNLSPSTAIQYMFDNPSALMMNGAKAKFGSAVESSIYGRAVSEVAYRTMELGGLRGFLAATALGTQMPFAANKYLQMYGEGDGFMKDYWTMNMNDIGGGLSEMLRRFGPSQRIKTENPLENAMSYNFPYNLSIKGDPYTTIKGGLFRLPGPSLEAIRDISHTFPASAQMLGRTVTEIRDIMVGWEDIHDDKEKNLLENQLDIREIILNMFRQNGLLMREKKPIYDVNNDIIGIADGIIKHGKVTEVLSVKPISSEEYTNLSNPDETHISEMNFYLANQKAKRGLIIYVNKHNPAQMKEFIVSYDPHRYEEDIARVKRAREKAEEIRYAGYAYDYGRSYSWLDKLRIYADVSPFSDQYKMALGIVQRQIRSGVLPPESRDEVEDIISKRNARIQRYPVFFRRFSEPTIFGTIRDILKPKKVTERQIKMSFSPFIKPPEEYSLPERLIGAAWETFTHANTPYQRKFFFQQDPYELYKNFHLYDKEYKSWTSPYDDWIKPYINTAMASRTMMEGVANFTTAGWLIGGVTGASFAGIMGAAYAPISNKVQRLAGAFIPSSTKKARKVLDFYDKVKYVRNMQFYSMTGNSNYLENANKTMTGASNISSYMSGLPGNEKFFASAFMNITDPREQSMVMQLAPDYVKPVIKAAWTGRDVGNFTDDEHGKLPIPESSWVGWDIGMDDSDIETKELMEVGVNPRDYGFGYNEQMMRASFLDDDATLLMDKDESDYTDVDFTKISGSIRTRLASYGIHASVSVIGSPSHSIHVKLFIP